MKPSPLRYHRPASLGEALDLLAELGDDAKVLAGGQSLVPLLSMRLAAPAHVVDVNALPGLDRVEVRDGAVHVGALVRHTGLERDDRAASAVPLLRRAVRLVAHATIRNRGTTVGSLAHADPCAEMPAVLALLGGHVVVRSAGAERMVAAGELFVAPLETSLRAGELVVRAVFPAPGAGTGTAVVEVCRRHGDYAVAGVAAKVRVEGGLVADVSAAYVTAGELGAVVDLGEALVGQDARTAACVEAGDLAHERVAAEQDIHASAAYRAHLVRVLTTRAVRQAAAEAVAREDAA